MAKIVESNAICVWVESHSYFSATNRPTGHNQKIQRPADQRIGRPEPPHQELQLPTGGRNNKSIARPNESIQRIKPIEGPTNNKPSMPITNNQCSRPSRHNNNWPTPAAIQQPKFTGKKQQQCDSRIHKKRSLPTPPQEEGLGERGYWAGGSLEPGWLCQRRSGARHDSLMKSLGSTTKNPTVGSLSTAIHQTTCAILSQFDSARGSRQAPSPRSEHHVAGSRPKKCPSLL